jgi:hypothetical protein
MLRMLVRLGGHPLYLPRVYMLKLQTAGGPDITLTVNGGRRR